MADGYLYIDNDPMTPKERWCQTRTGEQYFHGENGASISLGTDRAKEGGGPATVDDGIGHVNGPTKGKETGTVIITAGKNDRVQDNPDLYADASTIYLSMNTKADKNLKTDGLKLGAGGTAPEIASQAPAAIVKSDNVRIVCRPGGSARIILSDSKDKYILIDNDNIEIHLGNNFINIKGDVLTLHGDTTIKLGKGASSEHVILGNSFIQEFLNHTHPTPVGPSGPAKSMAAPIPKSINGSVLSQKSLVE